MTSRSGARARAVQDRAVLGRPTPFRRVALVASRRVLAGSLVGSLGLMTYATTARRLDTGQETVLR